MPSEKPFLPVEQRLARFLRHHFQSASPGEVDISQLAGDASARQYFRCVLEDGTSYVLVAYPHPFEVESSSYQQIYELFREIGIPVPETFAVEGSQGIVLQEDLGDTLLRDKLKLVEQRRKKLLMLDAIDYIVKIQVEGSAALKASCSACKLAFDRKKLFWELRFFHEHYLGGFSRAEVSDEERLVGEYDRLARELAGYPRVLCHRDFHVRNLMEKKGVLYVIDFQDARWGPPAYDLASLLKDSVELDERTEEELRAYYLEEIRRRVPIGVSGEVFGEEAFSRQFHLMSIQRLLKALGTYGFQASVQMNDVYIQYIEGTLRRTLLSLGKIPEFPGIELMVRKELDKGNRG